VLANAFLKKYINVKYPIKIFTEYNTHDFLANFLQPASFRLAQTNGQDEGDENEDLVEVHGDLISDKAKVAFLLILLLQWELSD